MSEDQIKRFVEAFAQLRNLRAWLAMLDETGELPSRPNLVPDINSLDVILSSPGMVDTGTLLTAQFMLQRFAEDGADRDGVVSRIDRACARIASLEKLAALYREYIDTLLKPAIEHMTSALMENGLDSAVSPLELDRADEIRTELAKLSESMS